MDRGHRRPADPATAARVAHRPRTSRTTTSASSKNSGRASGSVPEGRIIALDGEAGYQADLLRGGIHFGFWRWQYRVHKVRLVTIPQGKIGYVYARDGDTAAAEPNARPHRRCNNFQDARAFLGGNRPTTTAGQRGRQRGDPPRRRVRHQPGPVRRHHRGLGSRPATLARRARESMRLVDLACSSSKKSAASAGRRRRPSSRRPADVGQDARRSTASASSRSTTARRCRPAKSSPRPSAPIRTTRTTTTTTKTPRRSCGPAAAAAGSMCRSPTAPTSSIAGSPRSR